MHVSSSAKYNISTFDRLVNQKCRKKDKKTGRRLSPHSPAGRLI